MKKYKLGNCLRGYFVGEFESIDEAWNKLSFRLNYSFPSSNGRVVHMDVYEENKYGFEEWNKCKVGITDIKKKYKFNKKEIIEKYLEF